MGNVGTIGDDVVVPFGLQFVTYDYATLQT